MKPRLAASMLALLLAPCVAADAQGLQLDSRSVSPPIAVGSSRPAGVPTLTSGLGVPAGETFHLGERQTGDFTVSAKNRGAVAVTIIASRGERTETVGIVKPGATVIRRFQSGDGVLVRNDSDATKAQLKVEVWGTQNLAMYYVPNTPNDKDEAATPEAGGD